MKLHPMFETSRRPMNRNGTLTLAALFVALSAAAVLMVLAKELCHRLRHNSDSMLRREETMRDHYRDMDY